MDRFLHTDDDLSRLINEKARELYQKNRDIPLETLSLPGISDYYFKKNHNSRPFFSIQTAAELLYRSIRLKGKPVNEIVIMDYGAGIGNLYLLAKMIGCRFVIYNDIIEDMCLGAKTLAAYLGIHIDKYIHANHKGTLSILEQEQIQCDIILSRNVIEHIYDLQDFYSDIYRFQTDALLYFSTTANYHNPVNRVYHQYIHRKFEKNQYGPQRKAIIKAKLPGLDDEELNKLTKATRGLALYDLNRALEQYEKSGKLPDPSRFGTNTCDPATGEWVENLLTNDQYRSIIEPIGYHLEIIPAFWDTHNSSVVKNVLGRTMNGLTRMLGEKSGLTSTAFIYIIAYRK